MFIELADEFIQSLEGLQIFWRIHLTITWKSQIYNAIRWWLHDFVLPGPALPRWNFPCNCFSTPKQMKKLIKGIYTWNFIPGCYHPCLWCSFSHCLYVFAKMKLNPGMNSSLSKRQGWKKEKKRRVNTSSQNEILKWEMTEISFYFNLLP